MISKAINLQAWTGLERSRRLRLPEYVDSEHINVARFSALLTGHLYTQEISLVFICQRLSRTKGPIRNRTHALPAFSAAP
jgi:hypothetical protein